MEDAENAPPQDANAQGESSLSGAKVAALEGTSGVVFADGFEG